MGWSLNYTLMVVGIVIGLIIGAIGRVFGEDDGYAADGRAVQTAWAAARRRWWRAWNF